MIKKASVKEFIIKAAILAVYIAALFVSSGLTRIIMSLFLLCAVVCAILGAEFRKIALLITVAAFIPLSIYANQKDDSNLDFYHVSNQSIYQPQFYEKQLYPDAYVRELIKDKTVIVPYEVKTYEDYGCTEKERSGEHFKSIYYRENNYARYFNEYAKKCVADAALPDVETVYEDGFIDREDFSSFGCANDMLRYSFLINHEGEKEMSYFWYSWFYFSFSEEKEWYANVYIEADSVENTDTLVAIWDKRENLYLMSGDYYNSKVKR